MYGYSKKVTNFKYEDLFEEKFKEVKKEIYVIKRRIDDIPKIEDKLDEITEIRKNVKELKLLLTNFINSKKEEIKEDEATLPEERGDSDNSKTPDHPIINNNNNESNNDSTTISKIESVISKIESTTSKIETTTSKIESTTSKIESDKDEK
jgi:DNA repair exonuclease SbcCD ATPase subunit